MSKRGDRLTTRWERSSHTRAKHDILVSYLGAWFGILGNSQYHPRLLVLDGFAGPGRYSQGEPGSPVLAIETLLDHDFFERWSETEFTFLFNERDPARHASLSEELAQLQAERAPWPANVKVADPEQRSFSDLAEELLKGVGPGTGKELIPMFAFVDPFGYQDVPIDLIRRLVASPKAELFIYFDFNSVNRFAQAGNVAQHFTALFGTSEYQQAPPAGDPARRPFFHDLYERQLRLVCNYAHVRSFAMINNRGHIGNYLFFCTRNLQAFDRMKAAMWKTDPTGEYRFSDQLAGQDVLFGDETNTAPLVAELTRVFGGQQVSIDSVLEHVMANTPFHGGQVKRSTLVPMQREGLISSPNQRRLNFYPPGTLINFLPG